MKRRTVKKRLARIRRLLRKRYVWARGRHTGFVTPREMSANIPHALASFFPRGPDDHERRAWWGMGGKFTLPMRRVAVRLGASPASFERPLTRANTRARDSKSAAK
jgi:hypothetical protein